MSSAQAARENGQEREGEQRDDRRRLRENGFQRAGVDEGESEAAEILRQLSQIDDLPIEPEDDDVLGQLVAKLTSTTNLSAEQVESNEWVREYIFVLYLANQPTKKGLHGWWRGWAHGDEAESMSPLSPQERTMVEAFVQSSKLALARSEDAKVMEEATHTVQESFVHDDRGESGAGGLLGKIGLR